MNIFIIDNIGTIFFSLIATLKLLRKKGNSDIIKERRKYEESCVF